MQNQNEALSSKTSTLSLNRNVAAMLCYLPVGIAAVAFSVLWLNTEKDDRELRFHAIQGLILTISYVVAMIALSVIGAILAQMGLWYLSFGTTFVGFGFLAACIYGMVQAYQGKHFSLPLIGELAERQM